MRLINTVRKYYRFLSFNPKKYWTKRGGKGWFEQYSPDIPRNTELIIRTIKKLKTQSLIDIGCGYGRYLKSIKEKYPYMKLCGVDISPTQLQQARKFCQSYPDIKFVEVDGKHLPFDDNEFDVAISYGCMIHVPYKEIESFFGEIMRVTRKHGIFLESSAVKHGILNPPYYYFSHDYERLFSKFDLEYDVIEVLIEKDREVLYQVNFD